MCISVFKFSKKWWEGLRRSQFSEGVPGKGGDLFQGRCSFYIKNKLKSGMFNDKKYF